MRRSRSPRCPSGRPTLALQAPQPTPSPRPAVNQRRRQAEQAPMAAPLDKAEDPLARRALLAAGMLALVLLLGVAVFGGITIGRRRT